MDQHTSDLITNVAEGQDEIFGLIAPPVKRQRVYDPSETASISLDNIQDVWDKKISNVFESKGLPNRNFPIIESHTEKLPYKFFMNCPQCKKKLYVTLTLDQKPNGNYFKNYRMYTFTSHAIQCILENSQDFQHELNFVKIEPADEI
jgi:hypothetical protein